MAALMRRKRYLPLQTRGFNNVYASPWCKRLRRVGDGGGLEPLGTVFVLLFWFRRSLVLSGPSFPVSKATLGTK